MSWWKKFWSAGSDSDEGKPDYYGEGVELARKEQFHEALTAFRLALRERRDDVATLEQMAVVYTRMGMTDEALKMYGRALDLRPESAGAHYGLSFLLLKRGRREDAAQHLEAFLRHASVAESSERHVEHARETLESLRSEVESISTDGDDS